MPGQITDGKRQQVGGDGDRLTKVEHLGTSTATVLGLLPTVYLLLFWKSRHDRRGPGWDGNGGVVGEFGPGQILGRDQAASMNGLALREEVRMDLARSLGGGKPLGGSALDGIRRRCVGDGYLALIGLRGRGEGNHQPTSEMVFSLTMVCTCVGKREQRPNNQSVIALGTVAKRN